jgi:hypothetical protein
MYYVDLLDYLKVRNHASWVEAVGIIRTTWRYGPQFVKAEMMDDQRCIVRTHIGYGLEAEFEMDRDRDGKWQPVFGQIVQR